MAIITSTSRRIATRSKVAALIGGLLLGMLLVVGCGSNKEERGLQVEPEVTTPESPDALSETEKQRDQQDVQDLQEPSAKDDAPPKDYDE